MTELVKDSSWVRRSFLVGKEDLAPDDYINRTWSTASLKYTDTTLGGNFAINAPPQFTRHADPKAPSRFSSNDIYNPGMGVSKGMGRYYSEAIDDNSQVIHLRFGVPKFNSMTTFFTGFYNSEAAHMARTGRGVADAVFQTIGVGAAFVVSVMWWPLAAIQLMGVALNWALAKPSSKFYYLKPTMPSYWTAVTTMVNHISVNRGIIPRIGGKDGMEKMGGHDDFASGDEGKAALAILNQRMPDIFNKDGRVDVYSMSTKAQRLARRHHKAQLHAAEQYGVGVIGDVKNINDYAGDVVDGIIKAAEVAVDVITLGAARREFEDYLKLWLKAGKGKAVPADTSVTPGDKAPEITTESYNAEEDKDTVGVAEFAKAELDDGSAFVSFRVDYTGASSESFSNTAGESEIANKFNSTSAGNRNTHFNFAGGNIGELGGLGTAVGAVAQAVSSVATGAASYFQMSGLAALAGSAFVDIPKHWQSSTASLARANYTVRLSSPYGNPISQLMNIDIPLAMLLAAALPLSTGRHSYTSPFLLELYDKGRCQTRLGMIDSMSISRGTGNMGFNKEGNAMAIDVSFSVIDLSSIMHMPISEGMSFSEVAGTVLKTASGAVVGGVAAGPAGAVIGGTLAFSSAAGMFDDDTVFSDYMAVLAGMNLTDQIYRSRKFKLALTRKLADWKAFTDTSHMVQLFTDLKAVNLASALFRGTGR